MSLLKRFLEMEPFYRFAWIGAILFTILYLAFVGLLLAALAKYVFS